MIYTQHERFTLHQGDNRDVLKDFADNSIDSIVTDPPYELGFMGKSWDASGIAFNIEVWQECLRVLKPGGHLLAFSGSRTYHRMAVAIEDAGFEIRDQIMWIYGSGFPKSLDVSKAIDKAAGAEREIVSEVPAFGIGGNGILNGHSEGATAKVTIPSTDAAKQWQGWGTALKPAHEPIVVARKPLIGTVAANVLTYGTGGLNIDGTRVGSEIIESGRAGRTKIGDDIYETGLQPQGFESATGRFPANVIHDGSDEVVELFPDTKSGALRATQYENGNDKNQSMFAGAGAFENKGYEADSGSAARFFYCAKASKRDRNEGLDEFDAIRVHDGRAEGGVGGSNPRNRTNNYKQNHHPTVKPTALMQYLCKLVTPPGGVVLDPFAGSGSTGKAAMYEGFNFVGIELTEEYLPSAKARIEFALGDKNA